MKRQNSKQVNRQLNIDAMLRRMAEISMSISNIVLSYVNTELFQQRSRKLK
jgi:hypothetical protein